MFRMLCAGPRRKSYCTAMKILEKRAGFLFVRGNPPTAHGDVSTRTAEFFNGATLTCIDTASQTILDKRWAAKSEAEVVP